MKEERISPPRKGSAGSFPITRGIAILRQRQPEPFAAGGAKTARKILYYRRRTMMNSLFRGIIPPMVTPFDEQGKIDESALRDEVKHLVEVAGVHAIAVTGSTGEGHTLSDEEVCLVARCTAEEVAGRIPVIVGLITNSTEAAVRRAQRLATLEVAAFQVTPVHYLFRPDDEAMIRQFATIAGATRIPVLIYNVVPWSYLSPQLLIRILREVDGVVGVKQSASDMKALADLLLYAGDSRKKKAISILSAVDPLLYSSFQLGADGAIAAILSAAPHWCVALWTAVQAGNYEKALELHLRLLRLWNALDASNLPANVKTAMRLQGRQGGFPRAPMPPSSPSQVEAIREALQV